MLEAPHARVQKTLGSKRGLLDALAKLLIEKEVVNREAFLQLLSTTPSAWRGRHCASGAVIPMDARWPSMVV